MAILAAMQSSALRLMGYKPTVFFGASQQFELELTDLVNEVAADIAKSHDWQALIAFHTLTGDGTETEFALPDDYDRMILVSDVQNGPSWAWGYHAFYDINAFKYQEERGFQPWPGGWIIYGNRMRFVPAPAEDAEALFPYVSANYAYDTATFENKPAFTSDTDEFRLPERLLTLGLVWRWRENKKLDFTGDQEAFTKAISEYAAKDKGSRVFRRSGRLGLANTYPAYPYELGGA